MRLSKKGEEGFAHEFSLGEFRVHYYLPSGEHSMDAFNRNKAEAELLALFKEVNLALGLPSRVESQVRGEGGLVEFFNLLYENQSQVEFVLKLLTPLVAAPFIYDKFKQSRQQTKLNELNIQKARLEIAQKEREESERLNKETNKNQIAQLDLEPPVELKSLILALLCRKKIARRRSNFYECLLTDSKNRKVGFASSHKKNEPETIINRKDYASFVLDFSPLNPIEFRKVAIEIVSPVLRFGSMKWRGIFDKKVVSFDMHDFQFRDSVIGQGFPFQHGTTLICDLDVLQREDETGQVEVVRYVVTKVHEFISPALSEVRLLKNQFPLRFSEKFDE